MAAARISTLLALFLCFGCTEKPKEGTVTGKWFRPGYTWVQLIQVDKVLVPVTHTIPDAWVVQIHGTNSKGEIVTAQHCLAQSDWNIVSEGSFLRLK